MDQAVNNMEWRKLESEKSAIVILGIKSVVTCEYSLTLYYSITMSTPIDDIKNWSDVQLMEDENNNDGMSTTKYNEHWRWVKTHKEEAEQRAHEKTECHQAEE